MRTLTVNAQYLAQLKLAGEVEAEYRRRLAAEGFEFGEGAMYDCLEVSEEGSKRVSAIFKEVCEELLPCSQKP